MMIISCSANSTHILLFATPSTLYCMVLSGERVVKKFTVVLGVVGHKFYVMFILIFDSIFNVFVFNILPLLGGRTAKADCLLF